VDEAATDRVERMHGDDPVMLVWWATPVECTSALARLERAEALAASDVTLALARLAELGAGWHEVQPVERVRRTAHRLLRSHSLRAADALQLAAALIAAEGDPATLVVVVLDDRLAEAARREGLVVVDR
jgi:predicted nucleic acid-binding protein